SSRRRHTRSKRDWSSDVCSSDLIVTQSYYSKVEKNNTQLTANNLIDLLHYNEISVQKFFSKFDEENSDLHHQIKDIEDMIIEAYYTNNIDKMNNVKKLIYSSKLDKYDQQSKILLIDSYLALMEIGRASCRK